MSKNLPADCQSHSLSHEDGDWLRAQLFRINTPLAEYCFPNLYLFRKRHDYKVLEWQGDRFLSGLDYNGASYLMPLCDLNNCEDSYLCRYRVLGESFSFLFPLDRRWLGHFDELKHSISNDINDNDYLYLVKKFAGFPGKKMQKKRNHLNYFIGHYDYRVIPFAEATEKEAMTILNIWMVQNEKEEGSADHRACREAIKNFDFLNLDGLLVTVKTVDDEKKPVGFVIGEQLNQDTTAIHLAKGDVTIRGIYQYLFSEYCVRFCDDTVYVNLEQDLGEEGLRKTKQSYHPVVMGEKYRVSGECCG